MKPIRQTYTHQTCGGLTTIGARLAKTYAHDPKFYSSAYCEKCGKHFPVVEFKWSDGVTIGE